LQISRIKNRRGARRSGHGEHFEGGVNIESKGGGLKYGLHQKKLKREGQEGPAKDEGA
jgi:hypothetical protein